MHVQLPLSGLQPNARLRARERCHRSRASASFVQGLPSELAACAALAELRAGSNRLAALPAAFAEAGALPRLATLVLADNVLSDLASAAALTALRTLDVRNNELRTLPPALGRLTGLRALPLSGNPLKALPPRYRSGAQPARRRLLPGSSHTCLWLSRSLLLHAWGSSTSAGTFATCGVLSLSPARTVATVQEGEGCGWGLCEQTPRGRRTCRCLSW